MAVPISPEIAAVLGDYFPNLEISTANRNRQRVNAHQNNEPQNINQNGLPVSVNPISSEDIQGGSVVINLEDGSDENSREQNHGHEHSHNGQDPNQPSVLQIAWKLMQNSAPFFILMSLKILYEHRFGILLLACLYGTFYQVNSTLKKQISQNIQSSRNHLRSAFYLAFIVIFLLGNIASIYIIFHEQKLYKSLYFQLPIVTKVDFWTLIWIVGINDFIIKFFAISLKAIIALVPQTCVAYKRRGKYYMIIENLSQYYRCLIPICPWFYFLMDSSNGGAWFAVVLVILYFLCKCVYMWNRTSELRSAWKRFTLDTAYGSSPSHEEIKEAGTSCPICHDGYQDPIMLSCKHIFCEDCVSLWFDRERTCPMCRANIVENPAWRDGSTAANLQLF